MSGKLKKLWENREQIFEGVVNSILVKEEVEAVAKERLLICVQNKCGSYDPVGEGCDVPGTQPCCSNKNGGCGCSIGLKIRSMSSECPKGYWQAELTQEEEDSL